jgi:beta-galactosidase
MDATGKTILRGKQPVAWNGKEGRVQIPLNVSHPHLWNGVNDPYLYSVRVELLVDGGVQDGLSEKIGIRFFRVDPKLGFYLNGEHYGLRGVSRHQDREGKGWAVSAADEAEDMAIIREMGVNALRLAHYQQSESFLDLCDREGMIVWAEIPLINQIRNTTLFRTNAEQQLVEMIRQQRNHPSILMWGLFNELYHQGPTDPCEDLVSQLQQVAKQEDPGRLTTAASNQIKRSQLNRITDLIACNIYPGWYGDGNPAQMRSWLMNWLDVTNDCRLGVSEYGAGASLGQHEEWPPRKPDPSGKWHPEEYQAYCHEEQYRQIIANPAVWGSFAWNAFDFASDERDEGDRPGINDKGLVTYDRKTRKDAFYFYKANWNPAPMVHLNSTRFDQRNTNCTTVRAYSNCDSVELWLDGKICGIKNPNAMKVVCWTGIKLNPGTNQIQLVGKRQGLEIIDGSTWKFRSTLPAKEQAATPQRKSL